jgi:hypothetical protein
MQGDADPGRILAADERLHRGVHAPGPVHVDGDPGVRQFRGQVEAVCFQCGFGGGVGVGAEHAGRMGRDAARDVHDAPPPGGDHGRQYLEGEPGRRGHVDRERCGPFVNLDLCARAQRPHDGGVVDENLDRSPQLLDAGQGTGQLVGVGHVGRDRHGLPAVRVDHRDRLIEFGDRAGQHGDPDTRAGQPLGDGTSDATAAAGDQRNPSIQISVRLFHTRVSVAPGTGLTQRAPAGCAGESRLTHGLGRSRRPGPGRSRRPVHQLLTRVVWSSSASATWVVSYPRWAAVPCSRQHRPQLGQYDRDQHHSEIHVDGLVELIQPDRPGGPVEGRQLQPAGIGGDGLPEPRPVRDVGEQPGDDHQRQPGQQDRAEDRGQPRPAQRAAPRLE